MNIVLNKGETPSNNYKHYIIGPKYSGLYYFGFVLSSIDRVGIFYTFPLKLWERKSTRW